MIRKGDIVQLEISNLAFGGQGIGRIHFENDDIGAEGQNTDSNKSIHKKPFVVFVEDTVPGDKVEVKITHVKKKLAKGFVLSFLEKSSLRIVPRCKHFGKAFRAETSPSTIDDRDTTIEKTTQAMNSGKKIDSPFSDKKKNCGGCSWQFLSYEKQLEYKTNQVRESLEHLGGLDSSMVKPAIAMADPWYYRNKMEFSFSRDDSGALSLGLHMKGRHHDLTEIDECFLMKPFIGPFIQKCRKFFQQEVQIDPKMELKSLTIRQGVNTGEIMVNLSAENGQADFLDEFKNFVLNFFEKDDRLVASDNLRSIYFTHIFNQKGYRKKIQENLVWGKEFFNEELRLANGEKLMFQIHPQAFFQPNTKQAEKLYELVIEACDLKGGETIYDLFCGTGTIGIFAAKHAQKVIGIELNESAVFNARQNASLNGVLNIEFVVGDVNKILPIIEQKEHNPEIIIVDPPRAGLHRDTIETIIKSKARMLIYVSCNPTALARDLRILSDGGFRIENIQPVDQFCQTYHIETIAKVIRKRL